jgi:hypothetical protein
MSGTIVEYLLGIYFIVTSISWEGGRIGADAVRLIAGVVLFILAVLGVAFVR